MTKLGILISGRGSNMEALLHACSFPDYPAEAAVVISNKADAKGLQAAAGHGVATAVVSHRDYPDREAFERVLDETLRAHGAELVCLAGFMRVLTPWFVSRWEGRLVNIHPSLLPDFPGLDTHARALEAKKTEAGCTVHLVAPEVDAGPILLQARVMVRADDTPEILAARVLEQEHRAYPLAVRWLAEGKYAVEKGEAYLKEKPAELPEGFSVTIAD